MSNTLTIRLPDELDQWLDSEARKTGLPKSRIVRDQLELARTKKARQPFLDLAGSVEGSPDLSSKRGFER
jgi:predicted transcriptional regulator